MEFLGKKIEFGERAKLENIPASASEDQVLRNESVLFEIEKKVIEEEIEYSINSTFEKERNITENIKNQKWQELEKNIKSKYCNVETDRLNEDLRKKVESGEFFRKVPRKSKITIWGILLAIGIIMETLVLVVQSILGGDFNPIILLYGALLGFGGFLIGHGLSDMIVEWDFRKKGEFKEEHRKSLASIIGIAIGLIIVLFVAFIRQLGLEEASEKIVAVSLTFVLAALVAFLESMRNKFIKEREYYLSVFQKALQYIASKKHKENLESYKAFFDTKWGEKENTN